MNINRWAVMDDNGIIHESKDQEEMELAFDTMCGHLDTSEKNRKRLEKEWGTEWDGTLRLIEIHANYK